MKPVFDPQISFTVKKSKTSKLYSNYRSNSLHKKTKCLHLFKIFSKDKFCANCACIHYTHTYSPSSKKTIITSIKPTNLNYDIEIDPVEELETMKIIATNQDKLSQKELSQVNSELMLDKRKKIISKITKACKKYNFSQITFQLTIYLMDLISGKFHPLPFHKYEKIALCVFLIVIKFTDIEYKFRDIKQILSCFDNSSIYSVTQIKHCEISSLQKLKYNPNHITFALVSNFLYLHGITFSFDKSNGDSVGYLISRLIKSIQFNSISYLQYNQFNLGCAVIATSRVISKLQKWPKVFEEVYHIKESDFAKEYEFVYHSYISKNKSTINIGRNSKRARVERKNIVLSQPKKMMSQSMDMTRDTSGVHTNSKKSRQASVDIVNSSSRDTYKKKKKINRGVGLYLKYGAVTITEISDASKSKTKKEVTKLNSLNNSNDKGIYTYRQKTHSKMEYSKDPKNFIHNVKIFSASFHNNNYSSNIRNNNTKLSLSMRNTCNVSKMVKTNNRYNRNEIKKSLLTKNSVDIIEELIKDKIRHSMKLSHDIEKSILKTSLQGYNNNNNINKNKKLSKLTSIKHINNK